MRLRTGGFVTSVQFAVVRSEFRCNPKAVEGTVQERSRLVFEVAMFNCGAGVDCAIQIPPPVKGLFSPVAAAANLHPSAEEATQVQFCPGTLLEVHVAPEFVEV